MDHPPLDGEHAVVSYFLNGLLEHDQLVQELHDSFWGKVDHFAAELRLRPVATLVVGGSAARYGLAEDYNLVVRTIVRRTNDNGVLAISGVPLGGPSSRTAIA